MKFSEAWLREWVNPSVNTTELSDQLSMAGLEVDSIEPVAPPFTGVVVGEVLSVEDHPDAQKLHICRVNVGEGEALQIVCGAANVAQGMKVPTALVGAVMPGDFKIKKAKLRGIESFGMLCAAAELGLAESSEGLMPLPDDAPIGQDLRDYLSLDDQTIELDLTPDRGDCLGIIGIARDVGVINGSPVSVPEMPEVAAVITDSFPVKLEAPQACPRYLCRVIRGIDPSAKTPQWMQERLRRSGIRSISPVVDVTNYVLLELGQPMHGFDLAKLDTEIVVRMAQPEEPLTLLDGQEVKLTDETLVIADASRVLAIAGVMGGDDSGVTDATQDILLESAFFTPIFIAGKARGYGLHTDASHRFERGVDPSGQARAIERATRLLLDITGGQAGPVVDVTDKNTLPEISQILLRFERVARILGVEIAKDQIADILTRLEMELEATDAGWLVTPPSCRFDIRIEVDLIEEIGRIYGYANIPFSRGHSGTVMGTRSEASYDLLRAKELLVDRGYNEVVTYSFISPELHQLFDDRHEGVKLANPISADMSIMRTSLWPGLAQVAKYNQARQQERVQIVESGLRFLEEDGELQQDMILAGLIMGKMLPEQWGEASREVDFYDAKADVEALLSLTRRDDIEFIPAENPSLHPGQSAKIQLAGEDIGWVGMLHPSLEAELGLSQKAYVFELLVKPLNNGNLPDFESLSKFPSVRRDIAIVVDDSVTFQQVRACVENECPQILKDLRLFDVYTGERVDSGRKSLALGLILQETSRTLADQEIENVMTVVVQRLSKELGAQLRE